MILKSRKITSWTFMVLSFFALAFTACETEETAQLIDTQEFTDGAINGLQKSAIGKNHCLEFVFPIGIEFNDGTTVDVDSYESLKDTIKGWLQANELERSRDNKPDLIYPIQVVNQEGEVVDVASQEELVALKEECQSSRGDRQGRGGRGFKCFSLVYPITITIGDESQTFEDKQTLKQAVRAYKEEAGEDAERPSLVFPVTVELEDGTQQDISSQEDLDALKEECKN